MEYKFVFYIHSEIFDATRFENQVITKFSKQLGEIFEIARQLKAVVYYSLNDILELKQYFEEFDANFSKSQANRLEVLLKDFKQNKEKTYLFNINFAEENTSLTPISYPFLNTKQENVLNIVFNLTKNDNETLLLVKANDSFRSIKLNFFNSKKEIWAFINQNLPLRTYNFSPKHGNSTTKLIKPKLREKVSQLLSSDAEAQELLNSAIFDSRTKNFYYNFDTNKNTYIIFPYEGDNPQNLFHAFHILKEEWDKEIPKPIRTYFEY